MRWGLHAPSAVASPLARRTTCSHAVPQIWLQYSAKVHQEVDQSMHCFNPVHFM